MELEKAIDLLWEVKESKKHPNKAFKELCVLFGVSVRYKINGKLPTATCVNHKTFDFDEKSFKEFRINSEEIHPDWIFNWDSVERYYSR